MVCLQETKLKKVSGGNLGVVRKPVGGLDTLGCDWGRWKGVSVVG